MKHRWSMRARRGAAATCLLPLLVTGCSAAPSSSENPRGSIEDGVPGWEGEFASVREQATTPLEREILADDLITDEERIAAEDAFATCAARYGFEAFDFLPGGGYSLDGPFTGDGPAGLRVCERSFDHTSGLHWWVKRNPEGVAEADIMLPCLVRAGVVDTGFSAAEYRASLGDGGLDVGTSEFRACNADPDGAFAE
jgi:hypothetical protein